PAERLIRLPRPPVGGKNPGAVRVRTPVRSARLLRLPAVAVRRGLDPIAERVERLVKVIKILLGAFLLRLLCRCVRAFAGGDCLPFLLRAPLLLAFQNGLPL